MTRIFAISRAHSEFMSSRVKKYSYLIKIFFIRFTISTIQFDLFILKSFVGFIIHNNYARHIRRTLVQITARAPLITQRWWITLPEKDVDTFQKSSRNVSNGYAYTLRFIYLLDEFDRDFEVLTCVQSIWEVLSLSFDNNALSQILQTQGSHREPQMGTPGFPTLKSGGLGPPGTR